MLIFSRKETKFDRIFMTLTEFFSVRSIENGLGFQKLCMIINELLLSGMILNGI